MGVSLPHRRETRPPHTVTLNARSIYYPLNFGVEANFINDRPAYGWCYLAQYEHGNAVLNTM